MSIKSKMVHWLFKDVVKEIRDDTLRRASINFTIKAQGAEQKKCGLRPGDIVALSYHKNILGTEFSDEFRIEIDEIK